MPVSGYDFALHGVEPANVVEPEDMVGMPVREEHGIHARDAKRQCLFAEIRGCDHHQMDGTGL